MSNEDIPDLGERLQNQLRQNDLLQKAIDNCLPTSTSGLSPDVIRVVTGYQETAPRNRRVKKKMDRLTRRENNLKREMTKLKRSERQEEMLLQITLCAAAELEWWGRGKTQNKEKR